MFRVNSDSAEDVNDLAIHVRLSHNALTLDQAKAVVTEHMRRGLAGIIEAYYAAYGDWPPASLLSDVIHAEQQFGDRCESDSDVEAD
jgi:hypothetical protein